MRENRKKEVSRIWSLGVFNESFNQRPFKLGTGTQPPLLCPLGHTGHLWKLNIQALQSRKSIPLGSCYLTAQRVKVLMIPSCGWPLFHISTVKTPWLCSFINTKEHYTLSMMVSTKVLQRPCPKTMSSICLCSPGEDISL